MAKRYGKAAEVGNVASGSSNTASGGGYKQPTPTNKPANANKKYQASLSSADNGSFSGRRGGFDSYSVSKNDAGTRRETSNMPQRNTRQATPREQANARRLIMPNKKEQPVRGSATANSPRALQNQYALYRQDQVRKKK